MLFSFLLCQTAYDTARAREASKRFCRDALIRKKDRRKEKKKRRHGSSAWVLKHFSVKH